MVEWDESVQGECGRVRKCIKSERNSNMNVCGRGGGVNSAELN